MTDDLLREIERVIYDELLPDRRLGTTSFRDLLAVRTGRTQTSRAQSRSSIDAAIRQIYEEREKDAALPALRTRLKAEEDAVAEDRKARAGLLVSGS